MQDLVTNQVQTVDAEHEDSDADSNTDWQEYTTEKANETPKTIAEI